MQFEDRNKKYPNPKSQKAKQKMSVPSAFEDSSKSQDVKSGECIKDSDG